MTTRISHAEVVKTLDLVNSAFRTTYDLDHNPTLGGYRLASANGSRFHTPRLKTREMYLTLCGMLLGHDTLRHQGKIKPD